MEEEHEVYGGDIPEYEAGGDMEMGTGDNEFELMKKRLQEMEEEAAALREIQAKVAQEMKIPVVPDPATSAAADQTSKQEADSRSIFVGNVDYSCTPEEVQHHFQSCGTVNRVTILTDKSGHPKGYAYVEFLDAEAVQNALLLNHSELHNRQLKVAPKRTNVPRMKPYRYRGRRFDPYLPYYPPPPPPPPPLPPYAPPYYGYGYGRMPRFRRPIRYRPY